VHLVYAALFEMCPSLHTRWRAPHQNKPDPDRLRFLPADGWRNIVIALIDLPSQCSKRVTAWLRQRRFGTGADSLYAGRYRVSMNDVSDEYHTSFRSIDRGHTQLRVGAGMQIVM
jgi:hypothetical protein